MTGRRSPTRLLGVLLVVLGVVLPPAASAPGARPEAPPVQVTMVPTGPSGLPQGAGYTFSATVRNRRPDPVTATITFRLNGPGGPGPYVDFDQWTLSLPPGGTETSDRRVVSAQWFTGLGAFRLDALVQGQVAGPSLALSIDPPTRLVPRFTDVTSLAGLRTVLPPNGCAQFTSSAAWGDVEGDGDLDLYVPSQAGRAQLWINDGVAHFQDEARVRGVDDAGAVGTAAVFADFDGDGDEDLYAVNVGQDRLYRNDGHGRFTDVSAAAGIVEDLNGSGASWGDYDGDGWLDLYVTNYKACSMPAGHPDRLYHNEGDGTFTDRTALLGPPEVTEGAGFQTAWVDLDGDGDLDLYLVNDYLSLTPDGNHLWRNDGPGPRGDWRFTEVTDQTGAGFTINSMGIGIADYDGDLDFDAAISNIAGNVLARNDGGAFVDVAAAAGVERPFQMADVHAVTWGLAFYDLNLDGWEDLYVAAGGLHGQPVQGNEVFVNQGDGTFLDLSAPSGAGGFGRTARGIAFADFDRDGRMDLYVVNQYGAPVLYRNTTDPAGAHWLEVRLRGRAPNTDACGAGLQVTAGGRTQLRQVFCGSISLGAGSDTAVHVGLGASVVVDSVQIVWPDGAHQTLTNVPADRVLEVAEP